jgi:aldoxime dehydratase
MPTERQAEHRRFPLRRPEGHIPPIPRHSAVLPDATKVAVLFLGVQSRSVDAAWAHANELPIDGDDAPVYADFAAFTDQQGFVNRIAALYWLDAGAYARWQDSLRVAAWRARTMRIRSAGFWWEPVVVHASRMETIAFKEYRRGFAGCPHTDLATTLCSGYWGAARDRMPAAAYDLFEATSDAVGHGTATHAIIQPPKNLAIIRSGVSWKDCDGEQLMDYQEHIKPKLDAGMDFLRDHPSETGCLSLRQVECIDLKGAELDEAYSLGAFVSISHLESWAKDHPSHLAIYTRAMAARRKYQDKLQLRTYNEIFIIDANNPPFEYVNCHPKTGLLPFLTPLAVSGGERS